MTRSVVLAHEDEPVLAAALRMRAAGIRHLPVVSGTSVVGLLDDAIVTRAVSPLTWQDLDRPVGAVMGREVVRVHPDTPLADLAEHLCYSRTGVVVVDEGRLQGVVTARDLLAALAGPPTLPRPRRSSPPDNPSRTSTGGDAAMPATKTWNVQLLIQEQGDSTHVQAALHTGERTSLTGRGQALRNPVDSAVPEIGDEIAAARALSDLAHQLLDAAASDLEAVTHARVVLHT